MVELGPGASNPCEEFIDINAAAQQMIIQILAENIQISRVGRPTITFVNEILRRNPAAMSAYEACRGAACAKPTADERRRAVARCSAEIIGRFMPPDLLPALLPTRIYFDFGANTLRSDSLETLDLVALFLMAHPDISVELEGHADPVGTAATNLTLGQQRAETVAQELLRKGVDPRQIRSVTSRGEQGQLSTGPATHWKDRRVEIIPSTVPPGP
jgi:outer membrane protein OmpA-like peptidoglycan-associated protein